MKNAVEDVAVRKARLKEVMKTFNTKKNGTLIKFGNEEAPREQLSWGLKGFNEFTGGLRRGNWTIAYGSKSVGKTTLVLQAIAHNQILGLVCCYIDMERTFDVTRAIALGVNMDELILITEADTAEQVMDVIIKASKEKVIDIFVVDSVQALSPEGEQFTKKRKDGSGGTDKKMSDDTIALLPRKLSEFFRRCAGPLYKANAVGILIGQVRTGGIGSFFVHDEMTGGQALKFYNVSTIAMRPGQGADAPTRTEEIEVTEYEDDDEGEPQAVVKKKKIKVKIGHCVVCKLEKTKITGSKPEGSQMSVPFLFESGFETLSTSTPITVKPDMLDKVEAKLNKKLKKDKKDEKADSNNS